MIFVSTSLRAQLSPEAVANRMTPPKHSDMVLAESYNDIDRVLNGTVIMFGEPVYDFSVFVYKSGNYKITVANGDFPHKDMLSTTKVGEVRSIDLKNSWYYPDRNMVVFYYETLTEDMTDFKYLLNIESSKTSKASGYIAVPVN